MTPAAIDWNGPARQPCPQCAKPKDKALSVTQRPEGAIAYCHRCAGTWFEREREPRPRSRTLDAEARAAAARPGAEPEAERHAEAARRARAIWNEALPAPADHPYLMRKRCMPHGARVDRDGWLVVPMFVGENSKVTLEFPAGELVNVQRIAPDGTKRFLSGARTAGAVCTLTDCWLDDDMVLVAEGFATAATVHEAMALPTIVAFSAGNLVAAARAALRMFPDVPIVIAADNDPTGMEAADAAAIAVCGALAHPLSPGDDWNDVMVRDGWAGVMRALLLAERKARVGA